MALTVTRQRAPVSTVTRTVPFNYDKYLASEPTLQGALEQIRQQRLALGPTLIGGEQQLFGRLGEAPDLSQPQFANLSPALRAALTNAVTPELQGVVAAGNEAGTSALARLQHDYGQTQQAVADRAAAQGRSGAYGFQANEALRQNTLDQYDARQKTLDALQGLQQTYVQGQQTLSGQASDAVTAAQGRASDLIHLGQLGPTTQTRTTTNPYLNPAAPSQVYTRVASGGQTSFEPRPTGAGYRQPQPPAPRPAAPHALSAPRTTRVY